jgi:hypothetical protein
VGNGVAKCEYPGVEILSRRKLSFHAARDKLRSPAKKTVTAKTKSETPYCDVKCYSFTNTMWNWGWREGAEEVLLKRKCTHTVTVLAR